jgi:hypothetical protein
VRVCQGAQGTDLAARRELRGRALGSFDVPELVEEEREADPVLGHVHLDQLDLRDPFDPTDGRVSLATTDDRRLRS